jgi:putative ABC transport system ATP-binding protein
VPRRTPDPDEQWKPGYVEPPAEEQHPARVRRSLRPILRRSHGRAVERTATVSPRPDEPEEVTTAAPAIAEVTDSDIDRELLPHDDTPVISAESLVRSYPGAQGVTALDGVSIEVVPGEFLALLGPSGSGKSTLLGLMAGLDRPEGGTVRWRGTAFPDLSHDQLLKLRRRRLGMVFQSFGLLPTLSAQENVELPLRVAGMDVDRAADAAEAWLARLGLSDRLENRVFELSAGQQQRVAVARALVIVPDVVLADEPIAEVDSENADLILDALSEVSRRGGAVVCATHNPAALTYASRAILLRDGRIEATGSPDEVATRLTTD